METISVAFQGEPGAYSEAAALDFFSPPINTHPCHAFNDVFDAVEKKICNHGIIPIENTLAGSIHRNYDLLLRHELIIVGEYHFRVKHCLLALPGVNIEKIKYVHSHPQALAQCESSLTSLNLIQVPESDTAGSARILRETADKTSAVIASKHAAEVYDLQILKEDLEDNPENYTRFLILATEASPYDQNPPSGYKTSIVFSLQNQPGALFKALSVFALRDIDLTKIESRPIPGKPWEYLFYIDFLGHTSNKNSQRALEHLQELTPFFRLLGSYPRHSIKNSHKNETKE
jgi:prephenate dehydratase